MKACALVVGINEYPPRAKLRTLYGAVADAVDFADWALDPQGGNVAPDDLYFRTWPAPVNPPPAIAAYLAKPTMWPSGEPLRDQPTAAEITQSIGDVVNDAQEREIGRIYIAFTGHGITIDRRRNDERPQSCFMAGDYVARYADGLVPCDDLQIGLERMGPAEVILIFDCCRTDLSPTITRPSFNWNNYNALGYNQWGASARAAVPGTLAFEIDEQTNPRGAFSRLLTFGLRHLRTDDELTTTQLEEYVNSRIGPLVHPRTQEPDITVWPPRRAYKLVQGPPLKPDLALNVTFQPASFGKTVLVRNYKLDTLAKIEASAAGWTGHFPVGKYSLEVPDERLSVPVAHFGPEPTDVTF
ncbi:MAG: hypothetical protein QOJ53_2062 [Sphingomonadales bacterium]|jgi:hypothetical protein|nr:hypothetical protein [Sphingomonadales bacterium]